MPFGENRLFAYLPFGYLLFGLRLFDLPYIQRLPVFSCRENFLLSSGKYRCRSPPDGPGYPGHSTKWRVNQPLVLRLPDSLPPAPAH